MLKRIVFLITATFIISACTLWKNPAKGWAGATGGEQFERLMWNDIKEKNWDNLQKHLEPNFVATSPTARYDKAAAIERWKGYELQSVYLADVQVQTSGADFVVTATLTVTGTANGKPLPAEPMKTMTVWQQVSKGFVAVAHSDVLP